MIPRRPDPLRLELEAGVLTCDLASPRRAADAVTCLVHELELAPLDQSPQVQAPQPQPPLDAV